jgi:hypothetical protein
VAESWVINASPVILLAKAGKKLLCKTLHEVGEQP